VEKPNRKKIILKAISDAYKLRIQAERDLYESICVYDLAESLGVEVRFYDLPSMEGMYYHSIKPHIILSSLRPLGRRSFTCAHELGHYCQRAGTKVDELVENWGDNPQSDPKELAADCFAGALLMPKTAVERAFAIRNWSIAECTPDQIYIISNYFGVGYTTLIYHLNTSLSLITKLHADRLLKTKLRQAQALALGWKTSKTIWIVDRYWTGRPIDIEVGDYVFVRGKSIFEGICMELAEIRVDGILYCAVQPGLGRLDDQSEWSSFVRVSRKNFVGRSIFRHLEEENI